MIHKRVTGATLFVHVIIGSGLYPWVNCTGIRTLNPGIRGSPLTHGYKTDPIMIRKRVTGATVCNYILCSDVYIPQVEQLRLVRSIARVAAKRGGGGGGGG